MKIFPINRTIVCGIAALALLALAPFYAEAPEEMLPEIAVDSPVSGWRAVQDSTARSHAPTFPHAHVNTIY